MSGYLGHLLLYAVVLTEFNQNPKVQCVSLLVSAEFKSFIKVKNQCPTTTNDYLYEGVKSNSQWPQIEKLRTHHISVVSQWCNWALSAQRRTIFCNDAIESFFDDNATKSLPQRRFLNENCIAVRKLFNYISMDLIRIVYWSTNSTVVWSLWEGYVIIYNAFACVIMTKVATPVGQ